jgi:hypothetical protein
MLGASRDSGDADEQKRKEHEVPQISTGNNESLHDISYMLFLLWVYLTRGSRLISTASGKTKMCAQLPGETFRLGPLTMQFCAVALVVAAEHVVDGSFLAGL